LHGPYHSANISSGKFAGKFVSWLLPFAFGFMFVNTSTEIGVDMSEVLVVASKVKALIKKQSEMNTSSNVMEALTKIIEREVSRAIERAKADKRKTVMDRDFEI
jgi:histone H3/H4